MHKARHHGKQRSTRSHEAKCLAHMIRIAALAFPVIGPERARKMGIGSRIPDLVDSIQNAALDIPTGSVRLSVGALKKSGVQNVQELSRLSEITGPTNTLTRS